MTSVRLISRDERSAAAVALGDAFADDPVMGWLGGFSDDARRTTHIMRGAIDARFRRTGSPLVFMSEDGAGAAIWDPPGADGITHRELLRALPAVVRGFRFGVGRVMKLIEVTDQHHPADPHYYLFAIGAHRAAQGKGLGSALLHAMLERCDDEGVPAYLENSKPRNEAFYARHGFVAGDLLSTPPGCPVLQPMWRAPR